MQYEIILKNDKIKSYRTITAIILLLNLLGFILFLFYDAYRFAAASALLLAGIYAFFRWYFFKKGGRGNYSDQGILFVMAGCWIAFQNFYMVTLLIAMGILYHFALQKLHFVFNDSQINKLNFPKKKYDWNHFNNVIIKDNILTLDFKNNHLIQAEIEKPQKIDENQFNLFVRQQVSQKSDSFAELITTTRK